MTTHLDWYAGRPVVVTGGMGFIGSNLALRLDDLGAAVTVIDASIPDLGANPHNVADLSSRARVVDVDLRDTAALAPILDGHEVVFNLAGQVSHLDSMTDPLTDLELNGRAQLSLLEAVRTTAPEARVVFASTRQVYGRADHLPAGEDHPIHPTDVNGVNKHAAERYHQLYGQVHGIPTVVLRLTNTYGPRQQMRHGRQGFIPVFIRAAMEGRPISLYGGGGQLRDANHVDDVVEAFLRCGPPEGALPGSLYNLGAQPPFSLRAFAESLVAVVGSGSLVDVDWPGERSRIDIGDFSTDHAAITKDLGWAPTRPLDDGLAETVAFYREHGHHYW